MPAPLFFNNLRDWWHEHRDELDLLLFDVDGTLIFGRHEIPGAQDFLEHLRAEKCPFALLTNDANHSREEKAAILTRRGIVISPEEMISAGQPLVQTVAELGLEGQTAFVLGELGTPCYAESAGMRVTRNPLEAENVDAIVVGEGEYDWLNHITAALNAIRRNPSIPLISPNPDACWPGQHGDIGIGSGGVARFLSAVLHDAGVEIEPLFLGKPFAPVFHFALRTLERRYQTPFQPERTLMIGDNLHSDILGAKRVGMRSALVLTGMTSAEMVRNAPDELQPDLIFQTLSTDKGEK